jgi:HD-GYP domain-containing protein (c-di-GMP phosphodiesterase class II)
LPRCDDDLMPIEIDAGEIEWDGQPAAHVSIRAITELAQTYTSTVEGWARALELRDKETAGHAQRVTELTVALARAMGFSETALVHVG